MTELIKVLVITLVSDIDNMLVLGTILRKYAHLRIALPAIILLTITRVIYIKIISQIVTLPMLHLLIGIILLTLAFRLVRKPVFEEPMRRPKPSILLKIKVLVLIAATDFLICLDSVVIISGISQQVEAITLGIFCSLLISVLFLPLVVKLAATFFWITIIAGAVIAQNAVIGILKEPALANWLERLPLLDDNLIHTAANATFIIFIVIGVLSYIKNQRITVHK